MATPQAAERIRAEILESGRDSRYRMGGYMFVLNGLEYYMVKIGEKRHVSGQELSRGLAEFALKQYGPFARTVLEHFGIRSTDDFGYIVYNLIDIELMSRTAGDELGDFFGVLDFKEFYANVDPYVIDRESVGAMRGV